MRACFSPHPLPATSRERRQRCSGAVGGVATAHRLLRAHGARPPLPRRRHDASSSWSSNSTGALCPSLLPPPPPLPLRLAPPAQEPALHPTPTAHHPHAGDSRLMPARHDSSTPAAPSAAAVPAAAALPCATPPLVYALDRRALPRPQLDHACLAVGCTRQPT